MMKNLNFGLFLLLFVGVTFGQGIGGEKYNKWTVGVYGGTAWLHSAQLNSLNGKKIQLLNPFGKLEVSMALNHAIELGAYYEMGNMKGHTNEKGFYVLYNHNEVKFSNFGLQGALNLSLIGRNYKKNRELKWALYSYLGVGVLQYDSKVYDINNKPIANIKSDKGLNSTYGYFGLGVRKKLSRILDLELRSIYGVTFDPGLDGIKDYNAGDAGDNFMQVLIGFRINLGKHKSYIGWTDAKHFVKSRTIDISDTDEDGVIDLFDKEPDTPKESRVYGDGTSVDSDLDKIADYKDDCPFEKGSEELNGCPKKKDKDKDGVIDELDDCPNTPGSINNAGCPIVKPLKPKDIEQLGTLSKSIFFTTGDSSLRKSSYVYLDQIAEIIKKYAGNKFYIDGHTDSVGSFENNKKLSQDRANSVTNYLLNRGVNEESLIPRGFGEEKPIASNKTSAGKQLNRRTEINLVEYKKSIRD